MMVGMSFMIMNLLVDNIVIWVADKEWRKAETAYLNLYYELKEKFGGI